MEERKRALLKMKKKLRVGVEFDEKTYSCDVVSYDEKTECIYLMLREGDLSSLSLDAVYECRMEERDEYIMATGRIQKRYRDEHGKMLEIRIENGFYKNSIKSVDKIRV